MNALYVPILRAKQGEFDALGHLSPKARSLTRPMLDLPYKEEDSPLELQSRIAEATHRVAETWGIKQPIYFDISRYPLSARVDSGEDVLSFLFLCARQHHLLSIPTTTPARDRALGADYFDSLNRIVTLDGRGIAFRITLDTFSDSGLLGEVIEELLVNVTLQPGEIDIVLDVGSLTVLPAAYSNADSLLTLVADALAVIDKYNVRSVIFAASSFPEKVKKTSEEPPHSVTRIEVVVWRRLNQRERSPRLLFGDYGIVFPRESDPSGIVIVPSRIRLTTETGFLLFKSTRDQYSTLCREALKHREIGQIPQCWGLSEIEDTAIGRGGDSSPTVWVARDTNIHIETMAASIEEQMVLAGKWQRQESELSFPWLQNRLWPTL